MPEMTWDEETKIEDIADNLYRRIEGEVEKLLASQLALIGGDIEDVHKTIYPDDEFALASYEYNGKKILGVRISQNRMAIEFDTPNLETQSKGEVQNVQR